MFVCPRCSHPVQEVDEDGDLISDADVLFCPCLTFRHTRKPEWGTSWRVMVAFGTMVLEDDVIYLSRSPLRFSYEQIPEQSRAAAVESFLSEITADLVLNT